MEYFFYCRDKPDVVALRAEMASAHWDFMDEYADAMIARGPTLTDDGATATGSLHLVDLPTSAAAKVFAFDEPNYRAGVYDEVLVRRWRNVLGRSMWDFVGDLAKNQRFLVIGHANPGMTGTHDALLDHHRQYLVDTGYQQQLIAFGPLLNDEGSEWLGTAMLVELTDLAAVEAMVDDDPFVRCDLYSKVEVHRWQCGGRPGSVLARDRHAPRQDGVPASVVQDAEPRSRADSLTSGADGELGQDG